VKYKKCCLPKAAARTAPPPNARTISHRGKPLTISGNPSDEALDIAADYFERKDADEGFTARLMRFSQPLIEAVDGDPESLERAMMLGMIFWNMATLGEGREAMLEDVLKGQALSDEEAAEFREVAAAMIERHVEMFPALHAERGQDAPLPRAEGTIPA